MVQFYLLPPPPGQPPGQVQPFGPGVGNCLKLFCPRGRGARQIANNFSFSLRSTSLAYHFSSDTMVLDCVEKTAYFQGQSLEFVAAWLEKNSLSKLKSVFKGTFIRNCLNEGAVDAYSNGWRSSQT